MVEAEGAIVLLETRLAGRVAARFSDYLRTFAEFVRAFDDLERDLRVRLGFSSDPPVSRDVSLFPSPRALPWFEMISGHRLRPSERDPARFALRSQRRTLPLAV